MKDSIKLEPMTREMCHAFYRRFKNDCAVCSPGQKFEEYTYTYERVEKYWQEQNVESRRVFGIFLNNELIGEIKLKYIDAVKRECSMGIHMIDDSVKEKGYGTQAEKLILQYAFEQLNMRAVNADALLANTRSQHVLQKVGFCFVRADDMFKYYRCEK